MEKYTTYDIEITALDFNRELSDGRKCIEENSSFCQDTCGCCPSYKHYIKDEHGIHYIEEGDKIVLGEHNKKYIIPNELFNLLFKKSSR